MIQTAANLISAADYLEGEQISPVRHEYVDGRVYAMVGASDVHGLIAGSIFFALRSQLRGRPCQVFIADMKVRVASAQEERFYYPDVLVSCDPEDRQRSYRNAPCLIVEVLSAATERLDRGGRSSWLTASCRPSRITCWCLKSSAWWSCCGATRTGCRNYTGREKWCPPWLWAWSCRWTWCMRTCRIKCGVGPG